MDKRDELRLGFETAYIDGSVASNSFYSPQFVSNNYKDGKKVLSSIEDELLRCDKFQISVAFITLGGITPLLQTLKELEKKNIPGEILTTNYLNFSEPRALEKLNRLKNITLKMYDVEAAGNGFHTKGYIFKKGEIYCEFAKDPGAGRRVGVADLCYWSTCYINDRTKSLEYKEFGPVFSIFNKCSKNSPTSSGGEMNCTSEHICSKKSL